MSSTHPPVRIALVAFLTASVAAIGCSGGSSTPSLPEDRFVSELSAAICARNRPCCEVSGFDFDQTVCEQNAITSSWNSPVPPDPELSVAYDAAMAASCVEAVRAQSLVCDPMEQGEFSPSPFFPFECDTVYQPTVPPGGACTQSEECLPSSSGSGDGGTGTAAQAASWGSCLPQAGGADSICYVQGEPVRARLGDPCGQTCPSQYPPPYPCPSDPFLASDGVCYREDGLYCSFETGRCESLRRVDEGCEESRSCVVGAYCAYLCGPDGGGDGCNRVCKPLPQLGEECSGSTYPDPCPAGAYCSPIDCEDFECSYVCALLGGEGDPCVPVAGAVGSCLAGLDCSPTRRVCVRPAANGISCDLDVSEPCADPLSFCDPGTEVCSPRRDVGGPCSDHDECLSPLYCDASRGSCAERRPIGASCVDSAECQTGDCSADPYGSGIAAQEEAVPEQGICRQVVFGLECGMPRPVPTVLPQPAAVSIASGAGSR